MRSCWSKCALVERALTCLLAALLMSSLSGCSTSNEGNITTPPPPSVFLGKPASGGTSSVAGGAGTGGGVIPTAGSGGAGNAEDVDTPWRSSGCGKPKPAGSQDTIPGSRTGYSEFKVTQTGATLGADQPTKAGERQFFVRAPADYDVERPYRVVYIGQGCGAQNAAKTNTYPLFNEAQGGSEQAIYIGLSVPDNDANPGCYDNNSGAESQEWEAFHLIHTFVESSYCVDNNRIYVTGYSTGGWLANMWGCYFGGTPSPPLSQPEVAAGLTERKFSPKWGIRGHASVTGSLPPNQPQPCNGPSAGFWLHDAGDKSNLLATNVAALELNLRTNGCTGNYEDGPKQPWAPASDVPGLEGMICQEYTGCPAETAKKYPLVFCTTNGLGHGDQSSSAIPAITKFFDSMNPTQ